MHFSDLGIPFFPKMGTEDLISFGCKRVEKNWYCAFCNYVGRSDNLRVHISSKHPDVNPSSNEKNFIVTRGSTPEEQESIFAIVIAKLNAKLNEQEIYNLVSLNKVADDFFVVFGRYFDLISDVVSLKINSMITFMQRKSANMKAFNVKYFSLCVLGNKNEQAAYEKYQEFINFPTTVKIAKAQEYAEILSVIPKLGNAIADEYIPQYVDQRSELQLFQCDINSTSDYDIYQEIYSWDRHLSSLQSKFGRENEILVAARERINDIRVRLVGTPILTDFEKLHNRYFAMEIKDRFKSRKHFRDLVQQAFADNTRRPERFRWDEAPVIKVMKDILHLDQFYELEPVIPYISPEERKSIQQTEAKLEKQLVKSEKPFAQPAEKKKRKSKKQKANIAELD